MPGLHRSNLLRALLAATCAAVLAACDRARVDAPPPPVQQGQVGVEPSFPASPPVAANEPDATEQHAAAPAEEDAFAMDEVVPQDKPVISFARRAGLHRTKDPLGLEASAAIVIDQDSGEVLYQKNKDAVLPVASLTKLMTALVLLESKLPLDEVITITSDDVDRQRNSRSRVKVGATMTRELALHLALMSSENRAAHAIGRTFPGGMNAFVDAMNRKARLLGMKNTTFVDPTGLSNHNQSTVQDLALLAAATARDPMLREYSTTPQYVAQLGGRTLQYNNSNRLVKNPGWAIDLQKTGYILEAGQCLAMRTKVGGHNLIMVLLDSTSRTTRSADAERLRRFAVAQAGKSDQYAAGAPAPGRS